MEGGRLVFERAAGRTADHVAQGKIAASDSTENYSFLRSAASAEGARDPQQKGQTGQPARTTPRQPDHLSAKR